MTTNKVHDPENKKCPAWAIYLDIDSQQLNRMCTCEKHMPQQHENTCPQHHMHANTPHTGSCEHDGCTCEKQTVASILNDALKRGLEVPPFGEQQQAPRANCIYKNEDCPKCPTQKHDEIGSKCTLDFCPHSHTPESPQEPTPTSVTGEEWRYKFDKIFVESANHRGGRMVREPAENIEKFIADELLAQRTHIKQALLGRIGEIPYRDELGNEGNQCKDLMIDILNEELA